MFSMGQSPFGMQGMQGMQQMAGLMMMMQLQMMMELMKIRNVLAKKIPDAPHEVLLVLDATTGQNAMNQAASFTEAVQVTGIALTKLDGTAKGGIVVTVNNQLQIPVKFIGVGEGIEDLQEFDAASFVDALLDDE